MSGIVQEEEHPLLQQQQQQEEEENLRRIQRRYRFIALLGASMVLYSVAGKPSMQQQAHADAGCAVTGFLLWLTGATRLLPFTQVGRLHPVFSAGLAATTARFSLVLERMERLFSSSLQGPATVPA